MEEWNDGKRDEKRQGRKAKTSKRDQHGIRATDADRNSELGTRNTDHEHTFVRIEFSCCDHRRSLWRVEGPVTRGAECWLPDAHEKVARHSEASLGCSIPDAAFSVLDACPRLAIRGEGSRP